MRCGVEHCWECQKKLGIEYTHAVQSQGSDNGYYCKTCDEFLRENKEGIVDSLHSAYLAIKMLRDEERTFYDNFEKRVNKAELHLKNLLSH